MKERPILFSGPMVRAILEGRKTQTRRVVNFRKYPDHTILTNPDWVRPGETIWLDPAYPTGDMCQRWCPYGVPGDRLWVRETWWSEKRLVTGFDSTGPRSEWSIDRDAKVVYAADLPPGSCPVLDVGGVLSEQKWHQR